MLATRWTAARKFRAVFSLGAGFAGPEGQATRVAIARNCLIFTKKFSIR
jgi:hypothetical protein